LSSASSKSNASRRTRHFHQEPTDFHYPGLPEIEFHERELFPELDLLEAATPAIRVEFEALMAAEAAEAVPYIQYPNHVPLAQWRELNRNRDWTAIHLLQNGQPVRANADRCPSTMQAISKLPQPNIRGASPNAMFSLLAPPALAESFKAYRAPTKPQYALLAGIDALILLRRDVPTLIDEADAALPVPGEKMRVGGVTDLTDHAIVDRGRLVGLWQYEVDSFDVVTWLFGGAKPDPALREQIARTQAFVRDDLGDARSFSLDSPKSRAPRIVALRSAMG